MTDPFPTLGAALAGRYRLERQLGHGGMATVYFARDLKHDRPVALKVLRPELAAALGPERFLREIAIAARLTHPHILPLHDSGQAAGLLYYVMPYVEGESLRDRLDREKELSLDDALQITREVADALSCAHRHDVVHRDIKPENILLESGHAVVADFGIARAITAAGHDRLTDTGIAVGTPAYMSPEQSAGEQALDGRTDIYSLGCVLYEMLAGEPPCTGPSAQAIFAKRLQVPPPRISTVRDVPATVDAALSRALARTAADRFPTAQAFAVALAGGGATRELAPRRPRWRLALFGVAGAVVVGGALLVLLSGTGREASAPPSPVQERTAIAVLPFQNLSAEGSHAYFAGGLHDELLTQLSKLASLRVISRTSVMGYQGSKAPLRQIASELGVGSVMEGSVQVMGGRLRVTVQLIDAATDAHLWAERYDRTLDDAFAIQSEVAQQVVAAVGIVLGGDEQQRLAEAPTTNAEAYQLYLQGREYLNRPGRLRRNAEAAQQLFERALALDPGFALAQAHLSVAHGIMYWWRYDPSPNRAALQRRAAAAALRISPDLPYGHAALGMAYYWGSRDYRRARDELATALRGLPNDARIWAWMCAVQRRLGEWNAAVAAFERAAQLNPRDPQLFLDQGGQTLLRTRRYAEAVRSFDRALALAPDLHHAAVMKGWTYVHWQGRLDTLRAVLDRVGDHAELGSDGTGVSHHARLLLWERQADSLLQLLDMTPVAVFEGQVFFLPRGLYLAWGHQLRGDTSQARAGFESALVVLDSVLAERPDDVRLHVARGLAAAGLGRRREALGEADWLRQSEAYRHDAYEGPVFAEYRSQTLAAAGEAEAALDEIERLLSGSSAFSLHTIRLDPLWDPIRDHPRFRALLTKYATAQAP